MQYIFAFCHCVVLTFPLLASKCCHKQSVKIYLYVALITYDHLSMLSKTIIGSLSAIVCTQKFPHFIYLISQ